MNVTKEQAMDVLREYLEAWEQRRAAERRERALADLLRGWLGQSGEVELIDPESGQGIQLQEVDSTPSYDCVNLARTDPVLWARCIDLGLASLNHQAVLVQERAGQITGLARYRIPGPVRTRLVVIGKERRR